MKRFLKCVPALVLLSMIALLTGCGNSPSESSEIPSLDTNDTATSLVVYFSWSGNTEQMAGWIADESGSDLYRVTPEEAYADDFGGCADRAKNELDNGSSSGASSLDTLSEICVGANVLADNVLSISGDSVESAEAQISEWVAATK